MKIFCQLVSLVFEASAKFRLSLFATFLTPSLILVFGTFLLDQTISQDASSPIVLGVARAFGWLIMGLSLLSFVQLATATVVTFQRERDRLLGVPGQGKR